jgi:hypothetical protein
MIEVRSEHGEGKFIADSDVALIIRDDQAAKPVGQRPGPWKSGGPDDVLQEK